MDRICRLIKKHWDIVVYLFFGALTTIVNFLVYFPLYNWLGVSAFISNVAAWFVAVVFAYLTNKPFVFRSLDWSMGTVLPEFAKFVGCRVTSGTLESFAMWLFVDFLMCDGNWVKIIVSVIVVVLNYIFSKWIIFTKKENS